MEQNKQEKYLKEIKKNDNKIKKTIMIKKIALIIILSYLLISCGKKGDPKYSILKKNIINQTTYSIIA